MKITVFSDSHHDLNSMIYVLQEDVPDMVIHLGDNFGDARRLKSMFPEIAFHCVSGNCDFESVDSEKKIEIENFSFYITHGHRHSVKNGLSRIVKRGHDEKADVVLFGHTHISHIKNENGMWVINPGSISRMYKRDKNPTYASILIENGEIEGKIIERK